MKKILFKLLLFVRENYYLLVSCLSGVMFLCCFLKSQYLFSVSSWNECFFAYFDSLISALSAILFLILDFYHCYLRKTSGFAPDENIKNNKMEGKCENEKND